MVASRAFGNAPVTAPSTHEFQDTDNYRSGFRCKAIAHPAMVVQHCPQIRVIIGNRLRSLRRIV
jgi:hypothetical protein